ncbi:MAG: UDP-N-acetylmuramoyl-tripeptide--D-alanyl-D-alanine ligase [bacterium]
MELRGKDNLIVNINYMLKSFVIYLLRVFSKNIIRKYKPDVVGVTGSVGKTSSKEAISAVLATSFVVRSSTKNYNNEFGVPLAVIGVDKTPGSSALGWLRVIAKALRLLCVRDKNYPDMLVLEMGADKPGDIRYLTDIAPCKVGILTFISHAHTEFFKTIKKISQEKRIIISHLDRDGFAVMNFDNDMVMQNIKTTRAEVFTYGFSQGADLQATDLNIIYDQQTGWPTGLNFKIIYKGNIVPVFLPGAISKPMIYAALSGVAVGTIFGINLVEGVQALRNLKPLAGHMTLLAGIKDTLVVDDTYNSSPDPSKSALEALSNIRILDSSRRFAVLADMLQLGKETENAHREVGFKVAEEGIDYLITVGEAAKHTAQAAKEAGLGEDRVFSFNDSVSAGRFLQDKLKQGDAVLVKGSQSMRMEKVVKEIMAEPLRAKELLVRQGDEWVE